MVVCIIAWLLVYFNVFLLWFVSGFLNVCLVDFAVGFFVALLCLISFVDCLLDVYLLLCVDW